MESRTNMRGLFGIGVFVTALLSAPGCTNPDERADRPEVDGSSCAEASSDPCDPDRADTGVAEPDRDTSVRPDGGTRPDGSDDAGGLTDCEGDCESLSTMIDPMDGTGPISFSSGAPDVVAEGPDGGDVLRFEGRGSGGKTGRVDAEFSATIDLEAAGVDLREHDLLKLQVKADRAAFLKISADGVPDSETRANWWVLDALRGPFQWRTIWMDLDLPETVEREADTSTPQIRLDGYVKDTGRSNQSDERRIWLGDFRAVRRAVAVDWDQRTFDQRRASNGDLVYEYPVEVENELSKRVTAELAFEPVDAPHASATLPDRTVDLGPGESKTVRATLRLPEDRAQKPLYTERFRFAAQAANIRDSRVTILRSSDPIYLPVTVPLDDQAVSYPLFPTPDELPDAVVHFDASEARSLATAESPPTLVDRAKNKGIYNYESSRDPSGYRKALVAAAYLYDRNGTEKYLTIAKKLLAGLPEIWKRQKSQYDEYPYPVVSSGIVTRWKDRWHYTLSLGWRLMGTQRSPYQYSYDANAGGGSMSAMLYAYDMIAPELDPSTRDQIVEDFIVPAGLQCRNHYIGDGNQQATVNAVALYAGLVSENWPLVAFAHSSSHSVREILEWTFTDDGVHLRDGYQTYTLRPLFWNFELFHAVGVDLYTPYESRLRKTVNQGFGDTYFWNWVQNQRY